MQSQQIEPEQFYPSGLKISLARKIFHSLGLSIPIALEFRVFDFLETYFQHPTRFVLILLLASALLLLFIIDTLRFRIEALNRLFMQFFHPLLKRQESSRYNAAIPYLLAFLLLLFFVASPIIVLASLFLTLGDPIAAYIGTIHGRFRFHNDKSFEGTLAFLLTAFSGGLLYLIFREINSHSLTLLSRFDLTNIALVFGGALCAGGTEFFSVTSKNGIIDDNLLVPLASAAGLCLGGVLLACWPMEAFLSPFLSSILKHIGGQPLLSILLDRFVL